MPSIFQRRLREIRRRKRITQQWMADQLGIHRTTYTKYETEGVEPSLEIFYRISKLLDVDPKDLLE